jgi:hypothetical protein
MMWCFCRKLVSTKAMDNNGLKCAIDHILEAQQKGEINEDNVLYIVENINVAGTYKILIKSGFFNKSFRFIVEASRSFRHVLPSRGAI